MLSVSAIALVLLALVALAFALRALVEWVGFACPFCEKKVASFRKVDRDIQEAILDYFRSYEKRDPDEGGLFVCLYCKTVHDDFSGEKQSRDPDRYTNVTFCKVCSATMWNCEPTNDAIRCPRCHASYAWQLHAPSGFRFLMPPPDAKLLRHSHMALDLK